MTTDLSASQQACSSDESRQRQVAASSCAFPELQAIVVCALCCCDLVMQASIVNVTDVVHTTMHVVALPHVERPCLLSSLRLSYLQ